MDCLFCKIINNEIPSYTIYEDENVKCFLDINPIENGHTLIIPKKHFTDINDIDKETILNVFEASKKVIEIINNGLHPDGIKLTQNNGCIQDVKHFHLHVIPKYKEKNSKENVEDVFNKLTK